MEKNAEDVGEQLGTGESGAEASATAAGQGESGGVADHCEVDVDVAGPEENQPMLGPAKPNPRNYDRSEGARAAGGGSASSAGRERSLHHGGSDEKGSRSSLLRFRGGLKSSALCLRR